MMSDPYMKRVVISHKRCPDGTAAALAAYQRLGEDAEYLFAAYGEPPPALDAVRGRDVYLLDFCYDRATVLALAEVSRTLTVIDHYKTAETALKGLDHPRLTVHFDMTHSGAVLAWKYFFPDRVVPQFFSYVEDRDLWAFKFGDDTRVVNAGLEADGFNDPRGWGKYLSLEGLAELMAAGSVVQRYCNTVRQDILANAFATVFASYHVLAVNSPLYQSDLGNLLCTDASMPAVGIVFWWDGSIGQWRVSLRSIGDLDVSVIAKSYGGGGHVNAAGFQCDVLPFAVPTVQVKV